jgi:hypothetical protein
LGPLLAGPSAQEAVAEEWVPRRAAAAAQTNWAEEGHFASRDDLIAAYLERTNEQLLEWMEGLITPIETLGWRSRPSSLLRTPQCVSPKVTIYVSVHDFGAGLEKAEELVGGDDRRAGADSRSWHIRDVPGP